MKKKKSKRPLNPDPLAGTSNSVWPDIPMDGTSHFEISVMENENYSAEIIKKTKKAFSLNKLRKFKKKKKAMLKEGEKQIIDLINGINALNTHTNMFEVLFYANIGIILDEIGSSVNNDIQFMKWLQSTFEPEQMRCFRQARQLVEIGDFAKENTSLGINRLIELYRLKKITDKSFKQLLEDHHFLDTAMDMDWILFKEHSDSIITFYRLKNAGIDFVKFEQAALIAAFKHGDITEKEVKKVKKWLKGKKKQKELFKNLLLNKMVFPDDSNLKPRTPLTSKILSDFIKCVDKIGYDEDTPKDIVNEAFKHINKLKGKRRKEK